MAGGIAGAISTSILYPLTIVHTQLATQSQFNANSTTFDCVTKIFKENGVKGLYKGFVPSTLGIFFYRGVYFGGYDF